MTTHVAIAKGRRGKGPRSRKAKQAKRRADVEQAAARGARRRLLRGPDPT